MSEVQVKAKMKTLLIAYKSSIDNNRQTGAEPCDAPFMSEMEEIFGCRPIISSPYTTSVGNETNSTSVYQPKFSVSRLQTATSSTELATTEFVAITLKTNTPAELKVDMPNYGSTLPLSPAAAPTEPTTSQTITPKTKNQHTKVSSSKGPEYLKKKRPSATESLMKERLELSKEKEKNKQKRFDERIALIKEIEANKDKRFEKWLAAQK